MNGLDADTSCSTLIVRPSAQIHEYESIYHSEPGLDDHQLSIGRTPRSASVACSVGSIKIAAAYVTDVSVKCRLPVLESRFLRGGFGRRRTSASTQLVVFDLLPVKVIPGRGPIEGSSTLSIETNLTDVLCFQRCGFLESRDSTEKGLQCPSPRTDKPQTTELTLVDRLDGTQRSLPVAFEFYALPIVGGVAPAVVGDGDTVTVSGSNFPKGRARCRFGEQVIVESQAVWRDGLRCQVPPRHRDEDSKASRVVEVAFEGSDFLKTRTSIAHVLRPPSSTEVTQLYKGRSKI